MYKRKHITMIDWCMIESILALKRCLTNWILMFLYWWMRNKRALLLSASFLMVGSYFLIAIV